MSQGRVRQGRISANKCWALIFVVLSISHTLISFLVTEQLTPTFSTNDHVMVQPTTKLPQQHPKQPSVPEPSEPMDQTKESAIVGQHPPPGPPPHVPLENQQPQKGNDDTPTEIKPNHHQPQEYKGHKPLDPADARDKLVLHPQELQPSKVLDCHSAAGSQ